MNSVERKENWLALYICIFGNVSIDDAFIYVGINEKFKIKKAIANEPTKVPLAISFNKKSYSV